MSVLLQAARYETYNSVTTSLVTQKLNFSLPSTPIECILPIGSPLSSPSISLRNNAADVVSDSMNDTFWHHNFRNYDVRILGVADAILQERCFLNITGILQRRSASLFDTDLVTLNFTRLAHTGCYVLRMFDYFCVLLLTAHCTLQTHSVIFFCYVSLSVVTLNHHQ